ncbi:MAG: CPBP family intramembrane glutamic endopeptidase [Acidobacteriota bacterium]
MPAWLGDPTAIPLLAAFLIEAALYLGTGFPALREKLARLRRPVLALGMTASAAVSYVAYAVPTGVFDWRSMAVLLWLASALSCWYLVLPRRAAADLLFVMFVAGVILSKVFGRVYAGPAVVLGQLMWIRLGVVAALVFRKAEGTGFGFLPSRREWAIGIRHFLYFAPVGVGLSLVTGFARFEPRLNAPWLAVGTFFGMLWVVALSEEFFFRGLLQRWLGEWLRSERGGLVLASVLFGLAHLPFRSFPNWRFALLATVAGLFYGRAYLKAGGIRAAMVAHALVNTVWRVLFV